MQIVVTLTEINNEIERLRKERYAVSYLGRLDRFSKDEERRLDHYDAELKKWNNLRDRALDNGSV